MYRRDGAASARRRTDAGSQHSSDKPFRHRTQALTCTHTAQAEVAGHVPPDHEMVGGRRASQLIKDRVMHLQDGRRTLVLASSFECAANSRGGRTPRLRGLGWNHLMRVYPRGTLTTYTRGLVLRTRFHGGRAPEPAKCAPAGRLRDVRQPHHRCRPFGSSADANTTMRELETNCHGRTALQLPHSDGRAVCPPCAIRHADDGRSRFAVKRV